MQGCTSKVFRIIFIFLILPAADLFGQTTLPALSPDGSIVTPAEAPQAVFEYSIDNVDVNFFLLGDWEAKLGFAAGVSWTPRSDGSYEQQITPPSQLQSTPLKNIVDLVTSLWINNNFFFEASFRSGFTDNSILIGYYGEGLLREVKIGNTDIGIQAYPFLRIVKGVTGSPGIVTTLATDSTVHEFVLRYDASNEVRRNFIGSSEYIIENRAISEYVRGKHFLLPDPDPQNLQVWLEEASGVFGSETASDNLGSSYRLLIAGEDYGLIPDLGELHINPELPEGRILLHYSSGGSSVSANNHLGNIPIARLDNSNPEISRESVRFSLMPGGDFDEHFVKPLNELMGFSPALPGISIGSYSREIDGQKALVLYEPGLFSPFEIQAFYTVTTQVEDVLLRGKTRASLPFRSTDSGIQLSARGAANSDPWKIRYPLLDVSDEARLVYGPGSLRRADRTLADISLQFSSRIGEGLRITDKIVPGSLLVYRNSKLISDVELVDGLLVFSEPLAPLDDVLVVYRVPDTSGRLGNLSAATGHRFFLPNDDELALALSGSIGVSKEGTVQGGNPAYLQLSAAYYLRDEELTADFEGLIGYSATDSNEVFHPLETASDSNSLAISETTVLPSPPPESAQLQSAYSASADSPSASLQTLIGALNRNNRGELFFRNFRQGERGVILPRNYSSSEPEKLETAVGPYPVLAAGSDRVQGTLAALEFRMNAGEWVGYQIGSSQGPEGFISGFEVSVLPESLNTAVHVLLQAGELNEDIDGDRVLDSQETPEDRGIPFNLGGNERHAGYPGRSYHEGWQGLTEDTDRNGRLDSDKPAAMVSLYLGKLEPSDAGSWKTLAENLTAVESMRLTKLRAMRVVLVSEDSSEGRFFFGNQKIRQRNVLVLGNTTRVDLVTASPEHYRFQWVGSEAAEMRMPLSTVGNLYETLEIEINGRELPDGEGESLSFGINGHQLADIPLARQDAWKTIRVNLSQKQISLISSGGTEYSTNFSAVADGSIDSLEYISLKLSPSATGGLLLRLPRFSDSRKLFSGGLRTKLLWTPAAALAWQGTVFQTGLSSLELNSAIFSPGSDGATGLDSSIQLKGYLPFFLSSLLFRVYWDFDDDLQVDAFHSLSFNALPGVGLTNSFSQEWKEQSGRAAVSQQFGVSLDPVPWFSVDTGYQFTRLGEIQNRGWELALTLGDNPVLNTSTHFTINEGSISTALSEPSYVVNYVESIKLIDWSILKSTDYNRTGDLDLSLGLSLENFSADIGAELRTTYDSLPDLSENFSHYLQLGFHSDLGIDLVINASQNFFHRGSAEAGDFFQQMGRIFEHVSHEPFFLLPIYTVGVFSDDVAGTFFRSAGSRTIFENPRHTAQEYKTEVRLLRQHGLSVYDLLIPAGLEFALVRNLKWEQGLNSDQRSLRALVSWQALNLFGTHGHLPLFSTYRTDEIYMDIRYQHNLDDTDDWQIGGQFAPSFFDLTPFSEMKNVFDWKYAYQGKSSISFGISSSLRWLTPIEADLRDIFANINAENKSLGLEHQETLSVSFTGLRTDSAQKTLSLSEKPGFSILLRHRTALLFSEIGSFSADIALAYAAEALTGQAYAHRIGFELNAILKISY